MYIFYTKDKSTVTAVNHDMKYDNFRNSNNIDSILFSYNAVEIIDLKIKEYEKLINENTNEDISLKLEYLNKIKELEENNLEKLIENDYYMYSKRKQNKYIHSNDFLANLNNHLKLIDFYLEIKNALINNKDLNFNFDKNENQSKKLKFINLCATNIDDSSKFVDKLIDQEHIYTIIKKQKQKKLI